MRCPCSFWSKWIGPSLVISAALTCGAKSGIADFIAITTPTNTITSHGSYTLGYEFETGSNPLTVTKLGVWDVGSGSPGLVGAHQVAIFSADGLQTQLTSATVPAGTPGIQIGDYGYVSISPLVLLPSTDYIIVTESNIDDDLFHNSANPGSFPVFSTPDVNYVQRESGALGAGNTVTFPSGSGNGASAWDAPNFYVSTVSTPEPASVTLLVLGSSMALAARLRRRFKSRQAT
jgi:hypothetical protein